MWRGARAYARVAVVVVLATAACGFLPESPFTLDNAAVDPTYTCPVASANATYDLHAAIDAHNPTSNQVTIKSVDVVMTLASAQGAWLQAVGEKFDAGKATFTPATVKAGSNATLAATVHSSCTNGPKPSKGASYGEYSIEFNVTTSAGTMKVASTNKHRIIAY